MSAEAGLATPFSERAGKALRDTFLQEALGISE